MKKYFPTQKNKDEVLIPQKKGNYKNLSDMKPIFKKPRPQNRQPSRLTSSRPDSSLKSKLINDKQPLPPIPEKFDYKKFNQLTKTVIKIIKRYFKTTDPQTIKNILENQRDKKRDLISKQNEAENKLQKFLLKKSKCETLIHNFSPIKVRDVLLITEGKAALSFLSSEKEIILETLQNYQAQKNALMMSARRFCDMFNLPEVNDFEELKEFFSKLTTIIKKSNLKILQRGKVSFSIPDLIPSSRNENINNNNSIEFSSEENAIIVPRLSLASARGNNDFYPGTRSTRRALITFNSNSDFREILSGRGNNDLQFFGKSLGNIFVDRYCLEISQEKKVLQKIENNCEVASLSPIFVHKVNFYSCKEVLKNLADQYLKYHEFLYLSVLSDYEISKTEKSFLQFTAARNFLIQKLNTLFDEEIIDSTFDYLVGSNDVAACWFIRDIILKCDYKLNSITVYFEKLLPLFQKRLFSLSSVTELIKTTPFIAYFACFTTFLTNNENSHSFNNVVLSYFDNNLTKIMNIFAASMSTSISRCGFVALFQIGQFCPQVFYQCIEFQNKANSDFLVYLRQNILFTTCVKEATEFFNKCLYLLSRESSLFHTAMIFHISLMQLFNPTGINVEVVTSLLSCLITVVANRNKSTNEQLIGLGFLQYLMKNFELEAFLASNSKPIQNTDFPIDAKKPIINNKVNIANNKNNNNNNNTAFTKLNRVAANNNKSKQTNNNNNKSKQNHNNKKEEKDNQNNNKNDDVNDNDNNVNDNNVNDNNVNDNNVNNVNVNVNNDKNDEEEDDFNDGLGDGKMRISYLNIPKMSLPHLNLENPKLQLHFKPYSSINKNSVRSSISSFQYIEQRKRHPIYLSKELHVVYVQLMFALLIDHSTHRLDTFFCDPFPSVNRKPNVLFILMQHMEGRYNQEIINPLKQIFNPMFVGNETEIEKEDQKEVPNFIAQRKEFTSTFNLTGPIQSNQSLLYVKQQYQDYMRLLRLTVPSCFNQKNYSNGYHIASGAFGAVMGITYNGNDLAVKILEKSRSECDNPHLIEVYTEVTILETCKGDRRVTQLYDYGCSSDSYYIVMENYPTTLKSWRKSFQNQPKNSTENDALPPNEEEEDKPQNEEENKTIKEEENKSIKEEENKSIKEEENKTIKEEENKTIKEEENKSIKEEENKSIKEEENKSIKEEENKSIKEEENKSIKEEENKSIKEEENKSIKEEENKSIKEEENKSIKEEENKTIQEEENKTIKEEENESLDEEGNKDKNKQFNKKENEEENKQLIEKENEPSSCEDENETLFDGENEPPCEEEENVISPCIDWKDENAPPIDTLLRVYREFLNCATILTDHHINHFDIKCDNVMLDTSGKPALGDFGESMLYNNEKNCYTLLNRGTEWIKSPEMLSIALDSSANSPKFDRLRKIGAGPASDVWSIGCLFFELITGEYLFIDSDWSRFFMRVTNSNETILTDEKVRMLPDDPRFKNFIEFVLQRNVRRRPNLRQVIVKFDEMFPDASLAPLPEIKKRQQQPVSPTSEISPSSESVSPFSQ